MNYIALISRFWRLHHQRQLTGNQTRLYFYLLDTFNSEGEKSDWPELVRMQDGTLASLLGQSPNTMKKDREVLEARGLIRVTTTGRGGREGAEYRLIPPPNSSKRSSKRTSKMDEFEGEIHQKDHQKECQKDDQKDRQKECQKLTISYNNSIPNLPNYPNLPNPPYQTGVGDFSTELNENEKKEGEKPRPVGRDPFTFKSDSEKTAIPFSQWYGAYDLKSNEDYCRRLWLGLTDDERRRAMDHTPRFVEHNPNKARRPYPANYLANKAFNDEIIDRRPLPFTASTTTGQGADLTGKTYSTTGFKKRSTPHGS